MNTAEKRRHLSEYCEHRGMSDQCDGCVFNFKEFSCGFNTASDEEINKMYERYMEG